MAVYPVQSIGGCIYGKGSRRIVNIEAETPFYLEALCVYACKRRTLMSGGITVKSSVGQHPELAVFVKGNGAWLDTHVERGHNAVCARIDFYYIPLIAPAVAVHIVAGLHHLLGGT